ncbi:MAG: M23 family metallopeptidase [Gemmatimonadaceae bacterium]|nr:M23 family metallopeptidase [Gemmatimonadaceae bacterium]
MPQTAQHALTSSPSLRIARTAVCILALAACGPTLQPLTPRGPVPASVDIRDPETAPVPAATPAMAAAAARADAEYFDEKPLMVPVADVAPSALRDSYNSARSGGRAHRALDIPARRGTPVLAAVDGTILSLRQNTLGGTTLYLVDADRRFVYYYAHLDRYADRISAGVEVRQGQIVGFVGTSGNAPRNFPHLHFQALRVDPRRRDWWNGSPVDIRAHFQIAGRERAL